jgi:pyruvate formate lyase activating enzyme
MDTLATVAQPEDIAQTAKQLGCRSVAFTYNDPVIFFEYARDTAIACRNLGIKSVAVTAGYICEAPRQEFFRYIDAVNVDLKAFSQTFYRNICGGDLQPVLDTLIYLVHSTCCWVEVTTLLIPNHNDSIKELQTMTRWFYQELGPNVPLHFTAFHPDYKMRDTPPTSSITLSRARQIALDQGLNYVYTGNVHDPKGSSTYCPNCQQQLIERDWYQLGAWNIHEGRCRFCQTPIAGVFESQPGTFGARRIPLKQIPLTSTPRKIAPHKH